MGKLNNLVVDGVTDLVSYQLGVDAERERIIKLLKAEEKRLYVEDGATVASYAIGHAIAFIEGKQE